MSQRTIASRGIIVTVLILQVIPIMLFPAASFAPNSQEWWLPLMLFMLVVLGGPAAHSAAQHRHLALAPAHVLSRVQHHQPSDDALAARDSHAQRRNGAQQPLRLPLVRVDGSLGATLVLPRITRGSHRDDSLAGGSFFCNAFRPMRENAAPENSFRNGIETHS